jgi:hypothetical protein
LPVIADNQDEWLHQSNIFSHDGTVNVNSIGDESTLLEVPLSKTGIYLLPYYRCRLNVYRDCTNIYYGLVCVVGHMTTNEHQKVKDPEKRGNTIC